MLASSHNKESHLKWQAGRNKKREYDGKEGGGARTNEVGGGKRWLLDALSF